MTRVIDYSSYQQSFNQRCGQWKSQPVQDRKCNDLACVGLFAVLTIIFFGVGGYYLAKFEIDYSSSVELQDSDTQLDIFKHVAPVSLCVGLSIILGFIYILLVKTFPKIMVYTIIILTLVTLAILALVSLIMGNIIGCIIFGVMLIIYLILLACFYKKINLGILLVKVASQFMTQNCSIYFTPIIKIVFTAIIAIFWSISVSAMIAIARQEDQQSKDSIIPKIFAGLSLLIYLFFTFFFYYVMVFCIAVSCANWYYGIQASSIMQAYKWIFKSHFGSLTFAAIFIAVVTFIRMLAQTAKNDARRNKNIVAEICACMLICLLKQIQALLDILNHNCIIAMAVTGQSYIQSARTTIGLLSYNLPLLSISNMITGFLVLWGTVICAGIPTVVGYFWIGDTQQTAISVSMIFLFSLLASNIIFSVLVESVSSVFIFYCFDKKFRDMGYYSNNMPRQMYAQLQGIPYTEKQGESYQRM